MVFDEPRMGTVAADARRMIRSLLSVGLLGSFLMACGGNVEGDEASSEPPAVDTRFTLLIDGRTIDLAAPTGTRFVEPDGSSYLTLTAHEARRGGDYDRLVDALLAEPITAGSFDCTPDADGAVRTGTSLSPSAFFGFSARLTDCRIHVQYVTPDRIVGSFTVKGHAPEESSLRGAVSTATGEFDVPIHTTK